MNLINEVFTEGLILVNWAFWLCEENVLEPLCAPFLSKNLVWIFEPIFWLESAPGHVHCRISAWLKLLDWGYTQSQQANVGIDSQSVTHNVGVCTWRHSFGGYLPYLSFGSFFLKWHTAKEEWELLKVRDVLFIVASPAPSTLQGISVRKRFSEYAMI